MASRGLTIAATLSLLLIGFLFVADGYSATSASSSTGTLTQTTIIGGTTTTTSTVGGGVTTTYVTTTGGTTSTQTVVVTSAQSCASGYYFLGGSCQPIPNPVTTTTSTVSSSITSVYTVTSATATYGTPTNCVYNSVALICASLTVTLVAQTSGGSFPGSGDSVTVSGTLTCGNYAGAVQVGVLASGTTNGAGQYVTQVPAYFPIATPIGTATNVACTGPLMASEASFGNQGTLSTWPSTRGIVLTFVVFQSILGSLSPAVSLGPYAETGVGAIFILGALFVGIMGERQGKESG